MDDDRGLAERTQEIYARHADDYDLHRSRALLEAPWLRRFAAALSDGARVLDAGCGTGRPISGWLIREGFRLTGIDFADPMLAIARDRWPEADWRHADMRTLDLGETFEGILSWDAFFHLTPDQQRETVGRFARHLVPGGVLMLTVGPAAGEATGSVEGDPVYHASLSPAGYAQAFEDAGMRLIAFVAEDPDCDFHTVAMARKL